MKHALNCSKHIFGYNEQMFTTYGLKIIFENLIRKFR